MNFVIYWHGYGSQETHSLSHHPSLGTFLPSILCLEVSGQGDGDLRGRAAIFILGGLLKGTDFSYLVQHILPGEKIQRGVKTSQNETLCNRTRKGDCNRWPRELKCFPRLVEAKLLKANE